MGKDKKKKGGSKALPLLVLLLVVVGGAAFIGYKYPDAPVVGPAVSMFIDRVEEGHDQAGVYTVRIEKVVLSAEEFDKGETIDIQVTVEHLDSKGETKAEWKRDQYGDRLAEVGTDALTADWTDRPFDIKWQEGDRLVVKVWDYKGITDTELCVFESPKGSKEFPLTGTHTFAKVEGKIARVKDGNKITFKSERTGDITEESSEE